MERIKARMERIRARMARAIRSFILDILCLYPLHPLMLGIILR
jgi:hypothetical protein